MGIYELELRIDECMRGLRKRAEIRAVVLSMRPGTRRTRDERKCDVALRMIAY